MMKQTWLLVLVISLGCCAFAVPAQKRQAELCTMCEFFVQYIEGYLQQNKTQDQIIQILDQVCQLAPVDMRTQCKQFLYTYVPQIIKWIIEQETPEVACTQLGFCTGTENFPIPENDK